MSGQSPVEVIFFAALEKSTPAERAAYLDDACCGDLDLRRRVERLLAAHPQIGSFLESPASGKAVAAEAPTSPPGEMHPASPSLLTRSYQGSAEDVGSVIAGRYKLLERLAKEAWEPSGSPSRRSQSAARSR